MKKNRYPWWHGLVFYAGVQVGMWALRRAARHWTREDEPSGQHDRSLYRSMRLPAFAPPGWAFPVAWSINSACLIAGGLFVLNLSRRTRGRTRFLSSQGAAWAFFILFDTAYFGLRSPINAALVTFAYTGATAGSAVVAVRGLRRPQILWALASTLAWLALANPLAITQALWNRDPFWNVGPFLAPPAAEEPTVF